MSIEIRLPSFKLPCETICFATFCYIYSFIPLNISYLCFLVVNKHRVAGLYPNLAHRTMGEINFSTMTNKKAKVHISSVNAVKGQRLQGKCTSPKGEVQFIVFGEMVKGASAFTMNQTTYLTSPLPLILLCGKLCIKPIQKAFVSCDHPNISMLSVDNWLMFQCTTDIAKSLVILRRRLDTIFLSFLANPREKLSSLKLEERDALAALSAILESSYQACKIYSK